MKGGIGQLMKQAKQMQENMEQMQAELANTEVVGEAGAGMIKVTMTCKHEVRQIRIDDSLVGEERDMLEDLLTAGFNDALRKVEAISQEKMAGMTGGMGLPAGFKLPF
ncbi:MAG: YbaB/EbfC family nucleoid-associated protein [Pseudomonadota bacterium]